jgi:Na+-driven multidrug efflux pump
MLQPAPPSAPADAPRFVTGPIARHILVMTGTSAVGLMAIFFSDFANIFFLGLVGDLRLLAAVGYASSILFFILSAGIGMAIAVTALVAPALGARDVARARRLATHALLVAGGASTTLVAALWLVLPVLLAGLGAEGRAMALALDFLRIVLPSLPPVVLGMGASAVLRSAGDPQRAMYITLTGAVVGTLLDAVLQLGHLGGRVVGGGAGTRPARQAGLARLPPRREVDRALRHPCGAHQPRHSGRRSLCDGRDVSVQR